MTAAALVFQAPIPAQANQHKSAEDVGPGGIIDNNVE